MTENPQSSILNPQSAIDIGAIEKELTSLWQQASADEDSGVIRSSTLNLMVYSTADTDLAELDDQMAEITAARPCRAVVMLVDHQNRQPGIDAQVTSRCTLPTATSKQVCCEQVTITASGDSVFEVPSAVAPLLIPDLPVYLWWRALPRLQDRALFRKLVELSNRVIFDSVGFNNPVADLKGLATTLKETPKWTAISDLNWARLTAWRALLAGFYDVQEYRPLLDRLDRVVIEHSPPDNAEAPVAARGLLLGGWLSSRLHWKLLESGHSSNSSQFTFDAGGRQLTLEFKPTERKIEPGRLASVTINSAVDETASFTVRRSTDSSRIETVVKLGAESRGKRVLGYESLSESALIGREIDILGHDRVYEQAVIGASDLVS